MYHNNLLIMFMFLPFNNSNILTFFLCTCFLFVIIIFQSLSTREFVYFLSSFKQNIVILLDWIIMFFQILNKILRRAVQKTKSSVIFYPTFFFPFHQKKKKKKLFPNKTNHAH